MRKSALEIFEKDFENVATQDLMHIFAAFQVHFIFNNIFIRLFIYFLSINFFK